MKTIIKHIIVIILLICTENSYAQTQNKSIQKQVIDTFIKAQQNKDAQSLLELNAKLKQQYKDHHQNIFKYWQAYSEYYTAIFFISQNDRENSEKHADRAVDILESVENKTSEDYALLSLAQGFDIQFKNMIKIIFLSRQIEKNGKLAIEKDSTNLRAYYALASNDFYTPEKYGGGKHSEEYLLKAITLPEQKVKNSMLPSWGKEESYELLVRWYIRKKDWERAKKYHKEALERYPDNYMLNQLTTELKDK